MTIAGWIFMLSSWMFLLVLFAFCMYRTLRQKKQNSTK